MLLVNHSNGSQVHNCYKALILCPNRFPALFLPERLTDNNKVCSEDQGLLWNIESHGCKHCFGPHLALRNRAQKLCEKGTFGLERELSCLQEGVF